MAKSNSQTADVINNKYLKQKSSKSISSITNQIIYLSKKNIINKRDKESNQLKNLYSKDKDKQFNITSEYFKNILSQLKKVERKFSIKNLNSLTNSMNDNSIKISDQHNIFMTNIQTNFERDKSSLNKKEKQIRTSSYTKERVNKFENKILDKAISIFEKNKFYFKTTEKLNIPPENNNIIIQNKDIKINCYASKSNDKLELPQIIIETISKDFNQMTVNKSKYRTIQKDKSYQRIKSLEYRLPYICNNKPVPWSKID